MKSIIPALFVWTGSMALFCLFIAPALKTLRKNRPENCVEGNNLEMVIPGSKGERSRSDTPQPRTWWRYIKDEYVIDNRESKQSIKLRRPDLIDASEWGQGKRVLELLDFKQNGVFVEVGAYDGEFFSNTLIMEIKYNWTGVLIESVPQYFKKLLGKNRRACMVNICVSDKPWHKKAIVRINHAGDQYDEVSSALDGFLPVLGKLDDIVDVEMDCFPFFDILHACDTTRIDVLFLDIQGAEFDVLKTIPWHYVYIRVIVVEVSSLLRVRGKDAPARILRQIQNFLEIWEYELHSNVKMDYIFVRR